MRPWLLLGICCAAVAAPAAALAADPPDGGQAGAVRAPGTDVFVASGSASVRTPVGGDLFVMGGQVDVDAPVAGDALAVGGRVRLGTDVGGSVYAAAGQVNVDARVERSLRAVGGQIELGPRSEVGGNLSLAGGQLRLQGVVRGEVRSAGGRILFDGPVGGDVLAHNGQIELGPNARIAGKLRYRSNDEPTRHAEARVGGGIERLGPLVAQAGREAEEARHGSTGPGVAGAVWTLGLIVMAGALLAALPGYTATLAGTLRQRPGLSLLLGFIWLVCLPVAAVLVALTLVGLPLALSALAFYVAAMPVAYVVAGIGLGEWALQRWRPDRATRLPARMVAAALALTALMLLGAVPVLGTALAFAALIAGLGALLLQARRLRPGAGSRNPQVPEEGGT